MGVPTILVNAERYTSLEALAGGIAAEASKLTSASLRDRVLGVLEWFSVLKPQAEYDALTDTIKVTVAPREKAVAPNTLADALDALNRLAEAKSQRIGIIVDEFQVLNERGGIPAERTLRAVIQRHGHLSYVFAGSDTRMLLAMIGEHARPFYRLGDSQMLGSVPRPEFGTFISDCLNSRKQSITPAALQRIFEVSEDVPYNVQKLCAYIWEQAEPTANRIVDVELVESALANVLELSHTNFLALYLTLTATQQRLIAGMAQVPNSDETVASAARRIGVADSTYRAARSAFLQRDLLREDYTDRVSKRVVFVDPFFAAWLRGFVRG